MGEASDTEDPTAIETDGPRATLTQFLSLRRDVLVLSLAMFAFSLGFQMTSRYVPEYLRVLGAGAGVIGLYGSVGNLIGALYPYPGGALSDRIGSRYALTLFGTISTLGFGVWFLAPILPPFVLPDVTLEFPLLGSLKLGGTVGAWSWIFLGLFMTQAWKSLGLGATFAVVKQASEPGQLARGFASTEVFRRIGFLVGPLLAAGLLAITASFVDGFQWVLALAVAFGTVATILQHVLYESSEDTIGTSVEGIGGILADLRELPAPLKPLLLADTLVRFANGMVYVFFVIVVTDFLDVGLDLGPITLGPAAFFGVLLAIEMVVAIVSMPPVARLAERTGLKPVVAIGFSVYALFPILLVVAPPNAALLGLLFAFSGLRFAGLPAHKALIVGPAQQDTGGRVTGAYYLVRNVIVIPSAWIGGEIYGSDLAIAIGNLTLRGPTLAFGLASAIGIVGVAYFLAFGQEFEAYD
jgi:MFS family permease